MVSQSLFHEKPLRGIDFGYISVKKRVGLFARKRPLPPFFCGIIFGGELWDVRGVWAPPCLTLRTATLPR